MTLVWFDTDARIGYVAVLLQNTNSRILPVAYLNIADHSENLATLVLLDAINISIIFLFTFYTDGKFFKHFLPKIYGESWSFQIMNFREKIA